MKPLMRAILPILYYTAGVILKLLYRVEVSGLENLPGGKVLLCPNHSSDIDPVLIGCCLPLPIVKRIHFMAKAELFQKPLSGWFLRQLGAFPVRRDTTDIQAVKAAMQVLRAEDNLMIFPEGTTIHDGIGYYDGLPAHAHPGAVMIGVRTGAALIPVFTGQEKKLFKKTRIIFGPPYQPVFSGRRGTSEEMQQCADEMLRMTYALGGQEVGGKPLCR